MANDTGTGHSYRNPSWIERLAARGREMLGGTPLHAPLKKALETTLARVPGDHLVATLPGGERIRLDAANRQIGWNDQEYEAFKEATRPGAIVLDVGANLGAYTVLFAQWAGTGGRVYAFEPAPESRAALERQIALNEVEKQVIVRPEAIAASSGARKFRANGIQGDNRLISPAAGPVDRTVDVAVTSIDDFCTRECIVPDVIKLDVEGAELDALRGARRTIARAGAGLRLFVEMHPSLWSQMGVTRGDIEVELRTQGLTVERFDAPGDPWSIEGMCVAVRPRKTKN